MNNIMDQYKFINEIIQSSDELIQNFILDNIFSIVTPHDSFVSNGFFNYYNYNKIDFCKQNRENNTNVSQKKYFRKGFKFLKKYFSNGFFEKPDCFHRNSIFLIYVPNEKYKDIGLILYNRIKNEFDWQPIIIYYSSEMLFDKNYEQINLKYSFVNPIKMFGLFKKITILKKKIGKEDKHLKFKYFLFKNLWKNQIHNLMIYEGFKKLFTNISCEGVFSCVPTTNFSRIMNLVAKNYKIPTFSIRRGITFHNVENYFIETDYLFAKGDYEKKIYLDCNLNKKMTLEKVGIPYMKSYTDTYDNNKNILFVDQPISNACSAENKENIIKLLAKYFKKISNIKLIIKIHPGTKLNIYESIFNKYKINKEKYEIYGHENNIEKILRRTDYVFMHNSTVGFNALLQGKELIIFDDMFFGKETNNIFLNKNIAHIIDKEEKLKTILDKISNNEFNRKKTYEIKKFLKYHFEAYNEDAFNNILSFIKTRPNI